MGRVCGIEDLATLEQKFAAEPSSRVLDEILTHFCSSAMARDPRRLRYVVTLIEIDPKSFSHTTPLTSVHPETDLEMYENGCQLWDAHLGEHPDWLELMIRAARFIACSDRTKARSMLRSFDERHPGEPEIHVALAGLADDRSDQLGFLEEAEAAGSSQPNLEVWIARAAVESGAREKAERRGLKLLEEGGDPIAGIVAELARSGMPEPSAEERAKLTRKFGEARRRYHWHWGHTVLG